MYHSPCEEVAASVYDNAAPARAPFCGLSALSELAEELNEINKLAAKTFVDNKGFFRRMFGLLRQSKVPKMLDQFAASMRKLAQRSQGENLFLDDDGVPLSMDRVDVTYKTLLRPLANMSYILATGALDPPSRVNKEVMALVICKLAIVLHVCSTLCDIHYEKVVLNPQQELGEGLSCDLSHQTYQRTLHAVTRLEQAEVAWKRVTGT